MVFLFMSKILIASLCARVHLISSQITRRFVYFIKINKIDGAFYCMLRFKVRYSLLINCLWATTLNGGNGDLVVDQYLHYKVLIFGNLRVIDVTSINPYTLATCKTSTTPRCKSNLSVIVCQSFEYTCKLLFDAYNLLSFYS